MIFYHLLFGRRLVFELSLFESQGREFPNIFRGRKMKRNVLVFWLLFMVAWPSSVFADQDQGEPHTYRLPEVCVTDTRDEGAASIKVSDPSALPGNHSNLGDLLLELPGVSGVKRAQGAVEPVIRGLGWERVQTQVNGHPVYGACPARMDPPVCLVHPHAIQSFTMMKGLPAVTQGPAGTAGRVQISTDYERGPHDKSEFGGHLKGFYNSGRSGGGGDLTLKGGNRWVDGYGTVGGLSLDDYESAKGISVPARQEEFGGALNLGFRPCKDQRLRINFMGVENLGTDFPSLPMDNDGVSTRLVTAGYRINRLGEWIRLLEVSGGYSFEDHKMSNRRKPNRSRIHAETSSNSSTYSTRLAVDWDLPDTSVLTTGVDFFHLGRDAKRMRRMLASGMVFHDRIWPDTTQWDIGVFAEIQASIDSHWRLRVGGRMDHVESDARAVDAQSLGGRTIRENYVFYYGQEAAGVKGKETTGSGNVLLEWSPSRELLVYMGLGLRSRSAGITERYFAFAPAPGGFMVGNPTLDTEIKYEIDWGLQWKAAWASVSFSFFQFWFQDYIYQTTIDRRDVNGDGTVDLIRGFRNVDARFYGGEMALVLKPVKVLTFPASLAYVRAENTSDGTDLPEIPPVEGRIACRLNLETPVLWWAELGGRFVNEQTRIDPSFPEDETPGFAVFHFRAGAEVVDGLSVEAGVENLFDKEYHEHLTREALMAGGDLRPGDEIPEPGRFVYVSLRYSF